MCIWNGWIGYSLAKFHISPEAHNIQFMSQQNYRYGPCGLTGNGRICEC